MMSPRAPASPTRLHATPLRCRRAKASAPTGGVGGTRMAARTPGREEGRRGWTGFGESFVGASPPQAVWTIFADIPAVAACLDGAELTEHDASTAKGKMTVRLGPIQAGFSGSAVIERDDRALRGTIRGAGSDRGTGSGCQGGNHHRRAPEAPG